MDQQRSDRNDGGECRRIPPPIYESSKPSKNGRRRASRYNHQHQKNYQNYQDTSFHFQDHSQFSELVYQCNYRTSNHDIRENRYKYSCYYPFFSSSAAQIDRLTNFILSLSDLVFRTSVISNNLYIQSSKSSSKYSPNNRSQSRPLDSLNPNPVDSKPTPKPKLQCETEPERTSSVPIIQDSMHNPYVFRAA